MILYIYTSQFGRVSISDSQPFWSNGRWTSDDEVEIAYEKYLTAMLRNIHELPLPSEYLQYNTDTHETKLWGGQFEASTRKYFITDEAGDRVKFLESYDLSIPFFNWTEDVDSRKVFNTLSKVKSILRRTKIKHKETQWHTIEYHE